MVGCRPSPLFEGANGEDCEREKREGFAGHFGGSFGFHPEGGGSLPILPGIRIGRSTRRRGLRPDALIVGCPLGGDRRIYGRERNGTSHTSRFSSPRSPQRARFPWEDSSRARKGWGALAFLPLQGFRISVLYRSDSAKLPSGRCKFGGVGSADYRRPLGISCPL